MKTNIKKNHSGNFDLRIVGNERGSALLMTLGVLLLMLVIGLGFMFSALVEREVAAANAEAGKAKFYAESANARGMAIIQNKLNPSTTTSFSPLLQTGLFDSTGTLRYPATGYSEILKDPSLPKSSTNPQIGEMAVTLLNRTGKLDPNWFGRPSHGWQWNAITSKWELKPFANDFSTGETPIGMLTGRPPLTGAQTTLTALTTKERNKLFVGDPVLRYELLTPPPPLPVYKTIDDMPDLNYLAYLAGKNYGTIPTTELMKRWTSSDQMFYVLGWPTTTLYPDFLFPASPSPVTLNSAGLPDPMAGGSNTFIDWGADANWRNASLLASGSTPSLPVPTIKQRLPFEWFKYLKIVPSATPTETDVYFDDGATGAIIGTFQGKALDDCLPWFRMQYTRRVVDGTDPSSYYELVANFKDYATSGNVPTTNTWPISNTNVFSTAMISNSATATPYPFCGTKAVPNLAEIKLDYNKTTGFNTVGVELVNLYGSAWNLNDLATVVEAEWTDDSSGAVVLKNPQVAVVGFGTTGTLPSIASSSSFRSLTASVATTKAKTTRVRAYLVYSPGIGSSIATVTAATLRAATLLDTAILDIDPADQIESASGSGAGVAPPVGTSLIGCKLTVPVPLLNRSSNNNISKGSLCTYSGVMYVVIRRHKPNSVTGTVGSANWLNSYRALVPQPSPVTAAGTFTCTVRGTGTSIVPGGLFGYKPTTTRVPIYVLAKDANVSTTANRPPNGNDFFEIGEYIVAAGSLQPVYFEARDPRNNTCWDNQGDKLWSLSGEGSFGKINPNWWNRMPWWAVNQSLLIGDRVWYQDTGILKEYKVLTAHTASNARLPPTATTDFKEVMMLSGRDVWFDDDGDPLTTRTVNKTEDDVLTKPLDGIVSSSAPTTVDNYIRPSTAYVRSGPPQSLWELGTINRAEPWRTVRLSGGQLDPTPAGTPPVNLGDYAMGDWMLLDEVSLFPNDAVPTLANGYATEGGKVNPNPDIDKAYGMRQLMSDLGRSTDISTPQAVYCQPPTVSLTSPNPANLAWAAFPSLFTATPIISRGELALIDWPSVWNANGVINDPAGRPLATLDRSKEEIIGKAANLLQTRYQYFEIQATGRSYQGTESPQLTGEHKIRSVLERDAFTGKIRVISTEHTEQ